MNSLCHSRGEYFSKEGTEDETCLLKVFSKQTGIRQNRSLFLFASLLLK